MRASARIFGPSIGLKAPARRFASLRPRNLFGKSEFRQNFRRSFTEDTKSATPAAPVKTPRRFRILRWTWRIAYLSLIGGVAYVAYDVYQLRHPEDQFEQDPSKQNLVILGTS